MGASKNDLNEVRESETTITNNTPIITHQVQMIVRKVLSGEINPAFAHVTLDVIEKALKKAKDEIKETAIDNINEPQVIGDYKVEVVQGRKMYDFKDIPEVVKKESELKELKKKHQIAADNYGKGMMNVSESDGEVIQPALIKYGADYVKVTKNKK